MVAPKQSYFWSTPLSVKGVIATWTLGIYPSSIGILSRI